MGGFLHTRPCWIVVWVCAAERCEDNFSVLEMHDSRLVLRVFELVGTGYVGSFEAVGGSNIFWRG
jgi:hypothetical protein